MVISCVSPGPEIRYRYSAGGQRTYTRIGTQAPSFTLRDGAARLGTAVASDSGTGPDATLTHWNILTPSGTPVGRFVDGSGSERRYYHTDHLGSIRAVTDPGGQVVERKDFYPFGLQMPGRTLTQGPQADEDFTGHELDPETGLHYAGARYYMSALGRWGTPDPHTDRYAMHSPYNYALNNPVTFFDGNGKDPCPHDRSKDCGVVLSEVTVTAEAPDDLQREQAQQFASWTGRFLNAGASGSGAAAQAIRDQPLSLSRFRDAGRSAQELARRQIWKNVKVDALKTAKLSGRIVAIPLGGTLLVVDLTNAESIGEGAESITRFGFSWAGGTSAAAIASSAGLCASGAGCFVVVGGAALGGAYGGDRFGGLVFESTLAPVGNALRESGPSGRSQSPGMGMGWVIPYTP